MVEIKAQVCEGGQAGKEIYDLVFRIANKFFSLNLADIANACNERRNLLVNCWRQKDPASLMREYGLPDIPYSKGVAEAAPPFELFEPQIMSICVWCTRVSTGNQGLAAMEVEVLEESRHARVHVYLRQFDKVGGRFHWKGFCMPLEDILIHELLHACGDVPWRGRPDGVVRHNIIGVEAIKPLLLRR